MRRPWLPAAALTAALIAPAGAHATANFAAPVEVGPPGEGIGALQIKVAADGSALLSYDDRSHVFVAEKAPGATFSPPIDLGPGHGPDLAMRPDGQAILAWNDGFGGVRTALRAAGGQLVVDPAPIASPGLTPLAVSINPAGRAFVAYATPTKSTLASYAPGATTESTLTTITTSRRADELSIGWQSGSDNAFLLASENAQASATLWSRRWTAASGQAKLASKVVTVSGSTSDSTYIEHPVAVSGASRSIFWSQSRTTSASSGDLSFSSNTTTLKRVDLDDPLDPGTIDVAVATSDGYSSDLISPAQIATASAGQTAAVWSGFLLGSPGPLQFAGQASGSPTFGPAAGLGPLLSDQPGAFVRGIGLAPAGGDALQVAYTADGSVRTAPLTPVGGVAAAPKTIEASTFQPGTTQYLKYSEVLSTSGTGTGEVAVAWVRSTVSPATAAVHLSYGDDTPPSLAVAASPPADGATVDGNDAAALDAAQTVILEADAHDLWTPTTVSWDFGDGGTATGTRVTHRFANGGTFKITATARDLNGNSSTQTVTRFVPATVFVIREPATRIATTPPATGPALAKLAGLRLSAKRFAVLRTKKPAKGKGATISFTMTAAAAVEIRVARTSRGFASGKGCKATRPAASKKPKRCTLRKPVGVLAVTGRAGTNAVTFDGKVAGRFLTAGTYELTAAPVAPGTTHGTGGGTVAFTITR